MAIFFGIATIVWFAANAAWQAFPYVRNGTRVIIDAKLQTVDSGKIFPPETRDSYRVAFFGHSKTLAGFVPDTFDALARERKTPRPVYTYNLGLPGDTSFADALERIIAADSAPTHVFLLLAWKSDVFQPTVWKWFESDKPLIEKVFPFRTMPRDVMVFTTLARERGGVAKFYEFSRQSAVDTLAGRGYYFIEGQSHYEGHRLPDDFATPVDDPKKVLAREVLARGPEFQRLRQLAEQHRFKVYLVPSHHREKLCADAPAVNSQTADQLLGEKNIRVIGPDYWRYPNRDFSDPVHLNKEGAQKYTQDLWNLTRSLFQEVDP
jgi:hypothetical protein